jgi:putative flippase GtrA
MKYINREFVRFVLVGGLNTLLGYALYAFFLLFLAYTIAYTASYVLGIFISYYLNTRFVFRMSFDWKKALQYPAVYVAQYILGVLCLYFLVEFLHVNKLLASPLTIMLTIPATFLMSRFIIKGRQTV